MQIFQCDITIIFSGHAQTRLQIRAIGQLLALQGQGHLPAAGQAVGSGRHRDRGLDLLDSHRLRIGGAIVSAHARGGDGVFAGFQALDCLNSLFLCLSGGIPVDLIVDTQSVLRTKSQLLVCAKGDAQVEIGQVIPPGPLAGRDCQVKALGRLRGALALDGESVLHLAGVVARARNGHCGGAGPG